METLKEIKGAHHLYKKGYKDAIEGIIKDIQESSVISTDSIEKYLNNLIT